MLCYVRFVYSDNDYQIFNEIASLKTSFENYLKTDTESILVNYNNYYNFAPLCLNFWQQRLQNFINI